MQFSYKTLRDDGVTVSVAISGEDAWEWLQWPALSDGTGAVLESRGPRQVTEGERQLCASIALEIANVKSERPVPTQG